MDAGDKARQRVAKVEAIGKLIDEYHLKVQGRLPHPRDSLAQACQDTRSSDWRRAAAGYIGGMVDGIEMSGTKLNGGTTPQGTPGPRAGGRYQIARALSVGHRHMGSGAAGKHQLVAAILREELGPIVGLYPCRSLWRGSLTIEALTCEKRSRLLLMLAAALRFRYLR